MNTHTCRLTGTETTVGRAKEMGLDPVHPWYVSCGAHNTLLGTETRQQAESQRVRPDGWCEGCRQAVQLERAADAAETEGREDQVGPFNGTISTGPFSVAEVETLRGERVYIRAEGRGSVVANLLEVDRETRELVFTFSRLERDGSRRTYRDTVDLAKVLELGPA